MTRRRDYIVIITMLFLFVCCKKTEKEEVVKENKISSFQEVIEGKELRVAIINNSINYFIYRGTPMGFHYELVKEYADELGVGFSLHVASGYKEALEMLENGQCHILASNVSITGSRKQKMLFTVPLLRSNPVLVQNKNSKKQYVEDWLDVDSLKVAIPSESAGERLIENIQEDLGLCMEVAFYAGVDQEQLISWVAEDSIAATVADKIVAKVAKTYYPHLDISIDAGLSHNMAWAVRLGAEGLLGNINEWMSAYKKTRAYRRLYIKYFRNKKSILRNKEGVISSAKRLSAYDEYIKQEAKILGWDWRLLAALIYTESRFDISQVSWAGAFGLMQLMPVTAQYFGVSRNSSAKQQIEAGRKYLQYLEEEFGGDMVDRRDLKLFVLAAYNSGSGHIMDARNLAEKYDKDRDCWEEVEPYIIHLSKSEYYNDEIVKYGYFRGQETALHVRRITNLFESYKGLVAKD